MTSNDRIYFVLLVKFNILMEPTPVKRKKVKCLKTEHNILFKDSLNISFHIYKKSLIQSKVTTTNGTVNL